MVLEVLNSHEILLCKVTEMVKQLVSMCKQNILVVWLSKLQYFCISIMLKALTLNWPC